MLLIGNTNTEEFGSGWDTDTLVPKVIGDRTYA